jgi:hypothetical protein
MKHVGVVLTLLAAALPAAADPAHYTEAQIKRHYLNCDHVSSRRVLDAAEGAHCTAVADRLLKHHFRGDLTALLAWWRSERDSFRAAAAEPRER